MELFVNKGMFNQIGLNNYHPFTISTPSVVVLSKRI